MLERVWRKGIHLHSWWEFKLVQPLWGTVWRFLKKLKIELSYDPTIPWRRAWQCTPVFLPGATPWTVTCQASLPMEILQARILE